MKTKPKRIRALVRWIDIEETIWNAPEWGVRGNPPSEPCYILRQSDIRALAEQFVDDADKEIHNPKHKLRCRLDTALHILKRAGMTPGKERAK